MKCTIRHEENLRQQNVRPVHPFFCFVFSCCCCRRCTRLCQCLCSCVVPLFWFPVAVFVSLPLFLFFLWLPTL